jgi:ubiquinone/menaquinone biosynthesis C-methylase UbiE
VTPTAIETTLSRTAARALYDRIGRWQDTQRFYEDLATADLIAHADLGDARSVFEFGAGTGRLAERLLRDHLPAAARYHGVDISSTMVALARERLSPWASRAAVEQSDGSPCSGAPNGRYDRFLSTYVLDLLSSEDIAAVLGDAWRVLSPGGRLCLVSATHGRTPGQRVVMGLAARLHSLSPTLVGGCRAIDLSSLLERESWRLIHHEVVSKWGVTSEVLVASPRHDRAP